MRDTDEAQLVRAARGGAVECLGVLLARHRAGMVAVALSLLGHRPAAEDAVQEAALVALRRIGDLRDPDAVGPWLRAIVRNACRMQLRGAREVPVDQLDALALPAGADPADLVDRQATGDWVWRAVHELSPALRLVTMLRYFTDVTAYDQIAAVCGVPVGTVRSRLSQARARLAEALLATADQVHDDAAALRRARRREAVELLEAAHRGRFAEALAQTYAPSVTTSWPDGLRSRGQDFLVRVMDGDIGDGVRYRLTDVAADRDIVILRTDLISPPHDPFHCPPSAVWVKHLDGGRVGHLRLFHPPARADQVRT
ncbi:RNA polymerase sigma factor [Jidongwangia harbinensis]|uniref:RNA polymerase sigma factor n=1 Tax=Jidongwangia harbinensis TaxID=2878561 RepID=UPI001CD92C9B|nr:sigma-70 family RNA polymerase sigma factor [Jidongwangia harbinensis]MCA2214376.1 sigma-70 family RNA polymerase sigma factor [Jidongwangia harbinensis]